MRNKKRTAAQFLDDMKANSTPGGSHINGEKVHKGLGKNEA
jgi:hypothetical protein